MPPYELHAAAATGDVAVVLQLIQKQRAEELLFEKRKGKTKAVEGVPDIPRRFVELNVFNTAGRVPLHYAAAKGHRAVARLLLEQGAVVDLPDREGETALLIAAYHGHENLARVLLDYKARINYRDNDGWTALHNAAGNGHLPVGRLLIGRGADVNAKSTQGQTPVMLAAGRGHTAMVQLLVDNGADVHARNIHEETAYDHAAAAEHIETCDVLVALAEKEDRLKDLASTVYIEVVYENQQSGFIGGFMPYPALPFSDASGRAVNKDAVPLPSKQWFWMNEWKIDRLGNTDPDGWMYARDFQSPVWANTPSLLTFVRKRRWIRLCKRKINLDAVKQAVVPSAVLVATEDEEYVRHFELQRAAAQLLDDQGQKDKALEVYEGAIAGLIAGLKNETDKGKKQRIKALADAAFERAEALVKEIREIKPSPKSTAADADTASAEEASQPAAVVDLTSLTEALNDVDGVRPSSVSAADGLDVSFLGSATAARALSIEHDDLLAEESRLIEEQQQFEAAFDAVLQEQQQSKEVLTVTSGTSSSISPAASATLMSFGLHPTDHPDEHEDDNTAANDASASPSSSSTVPAPPEDHQMHTVSSQSNPFVPVERVVIVDAASQSSPPFVAAPPTNETLDAATHAASTVEEGSATGAFTAERDDASEAESVATTSAEPAMITDIQHAATTFDAPTEEPSLGEHLASTSARPITSNVTTAADHFVLNTPAASSADAQEPSAITPAHAPAESSHQQAADELVASAAGITEPVALEAADEGRARVDDAQAAGAASEPVARPVDSDAAGAATATFTKTTGFSIGSPISLQEPNAPLAEPVARVRAFSVPRTTSTGSFDTSADPSDAPTSSTGHAAVTTEHIDHAQRSLNKHLRKPKPRRWAKDQDQQQCGRCARSFSLLLRRHHCRHCGGLFCDRCSANTWTIRGRQCRVCDSCYHTLSIDHQESIAQSAAQDDEHQGSSVLLSTSPPTQSPVDDKLEAEEDEERASPDSDGLLDDCPKCGLSFSRLRADQIESHMTECFIAFMSRSPVGDRYMVYRQAPDKADAKECAICFDPFAPGQEIATLTCLCQYHKDCIDAWLDRGKKGCPVHAL